MIRCRLLHCAAALAASTAVGFAQEFVACPPLTAGTVANAFPGFVTDFDGDATPDLLYLSGGQVRMIGNVGLANTASTSSVVVTSQAMSGGSSGYGDLLHAGDLTGDGIADVVTAWTSSQGATIRFFRGTGGGQVAAAVTMPAPLGSLDLLPGDFDGDGDLDLVITSVGGGLPQLRVFLQGPANTFTSALSQSLNSLLPVPAVGDFNGDAIDDIALVSGVATRQAEIFFGGPVLGAPATAPLPATSRFFLAAGDLDGDGRDDLLVDLSGATTFPCYFSDPVTVLRAGPSFPGVSPQGPVDIDADGRFDVVNLDYQPNTVKVHRGDGAGGFSTTPLTIPWNGPGSPMLSDLDGDGDVDLLGLAAGNTAIARSENRAIYGAACAGSNGEPTLAMGAALPGNGAFTVSIRNAAPGSICDVLVGLAPTPGPCGPQVDLGLLFLPAGGFFGLVADPTGIATRALPIPAAVPISPVFLQGISLDPGGAFGIGGVQLAATRGRAVQLF